MMVFVLAWTIGDASSLACQSLNQVHFVYSSMSRGLLTQSMFKSNIGSGTTENVAMEPPPWIFGFMPLPTVALRSGVSFFLCMDRVFFLKIPF